MKKKKKGKNKGELEGEEWKNRKRGREKLGKGGFSRQERRKTIAESKEEHHRRKMGKMENIEKRPRGLRGIKKIRNENRTKKGEGKTEKKEGGGEKKQGRLMERKWTATRKNEGVAAAGKERATEADGG